MHKPLTLGIFYLTLGMNHGISENLHRFRNWLSLGMEFGNMYQSLKDPFCWKAVVSRGSYCVCRLIWHKKWYRGNNKLKFHIECTENDEGHQCIIEGDEDRFLTERGADILGSNFHCDTCWFMKYYGRLTLGCYSGDYQLLSYIRIINRDLMLIIEKIKNINMCERFLRVRSFS